MYGYSVDGESLAGNFDSLKRKQEHDRGIAELAATRAKSNEALGMRATPDVSTHQNSGNCGITLVTGLPLDPNKVTCGNYPIQIELPFDLACVFQKYGNWDGAGNAIKGDDLIKLLKSRLGNSNSCYMFTDAGGIGAGRRCRDWLLSKGYKVDTITIGCNVNHRLDPVRHHLEVFMWYDLEMNNKYHVTSKVYEVTQNEKQEEPKLPELGDAPEVATTGSRVSGGADGAGIRPRRSVASGGTV